MRTPSTRHGAAPERGRTGTRRTPTIAGGRRCSRRTRTTPIPTSRGDSRDAGAVHRRAACPSATCAGRKPAGRARLSRPTRFDCVIALLAGRGHRQLGSLRAGWMHDSRRQFGYSISPEEGVAVEAAVDPAGRPSRVGRRRDVPSCSTCAAISESSGATRSLAGRVAFAGAWGPPAGGGCSPPQVRARPIAAFDFGRDTIGLLRGVAAEDVVGSRAAVANVDLRFPLAYPERGFGIVADLPQTAARGHLRRCRSRVGIALSVSVRLPHVRRRRAVARRRARSLSAADASRAAPRGRAIRGRARSRGAFCGALPVTRSEVTPRGFYVIDRLDCPWQNSRGMKTKSRFLRAPVEPFVVQPDLAADDVLARMERISFQGRNLATARRIWEKMLGDDCTIFLRHGRRAERRRAADDRRAPDRRTATSTASSRPAPTSTTISTRRAAAITTSGRRMRTTRRCRPSTSIASTTPTRARTSSATTTSGSPRSR